MSPQRSKRSSKSKGELQTQPTHGIDLPPKDILDRLPDNLRTTVIQAASFTGPIPPPSMYSAYEQVLPGSTDRLMKMAEQEQSHRHERDRTALAAMIRDMKRVHWMSLTVSLVAITGAVVVSIWGNPYVAGVLGGTGLLGAFASIVSSFLDKDD